MKILLLVIGMLLVRFRESELALYLQYAVVIIMVAAAIVWLLRKQLFPKRYTNTGCGSGDCDCH